MSEAFSASKTSSASMTRAMAWRAASLAKSSVGTQSDLDKANAGLDQANAKAAAYLTAWLDRKYTSAQAPTP